MPVIVLVVVLLAVGVGAVTALVFVLSPEKQSPALPEPGITTTLQEPDGIQEVTQDTPAVPVVLTTESSPDTTASTTVYANGTYTADAAYFTPKRKKHTVTVTLALEDDRIADVGVTYDGASAQTPSHQGFDGAYAPLTLGVPIDTLDLSRVGGASLTTAAFNEALVTIKSDASVQ